MEGLTPEDQAWIRGFSLVIRGLNGALDEYASDMESLQGKLSSGDARLRLLPYLDGADWSSHYEQSLFANFVKAVLAIVPLRELPQFLSPTVLWSRLLSAANGGSFDHPIGDVERVNGKRALPYAVSAASQLRSLVHFRASMSELVELCAKGDDSALLDAVRIDPAVLGAGPARKMLCEKSVLNDRAFF